MQINSLDGTEDYGWPHEATARARELQKSAGWRYRFATFFDLNVLRLFRLFWYPLKGLWYRNGTAEKGVSL